MLISILVLSLAYEFRPLRQSLESQKAAYAQALFSASGCRVSVALTRGPEDLQTLLNYEAKPYVSMQLRMLFDVVPYKYYADPPPIDVFFKSRHGISRAAAYVCN